MDARSEIMNPLVAEQTEMRRSLIPGLLQSVEYNIKHSTANVQLYEIGTLFFGRENASAPKERESVAGVLSGSMGDVTWNHKPMPLRFFDGKGVVEELLSQLRTPKVRFRPADGDDYAFLQPGRAPRCSPAVRFLVGSARSIPTRATSTASISPWWLLS